jgi:predicted O-methyltransferase YrrM
MDNASPPPPNGGEIMLQMVTGTWLAQAISVAATLGIADLLAAGPRSPSELSEYTSTHANTLYRLLRALAGAGIFAEDAEGRFANTPLSEMIRSDTPGSLRAMSQFVGAPESWLPWGDLLESVRTGACAFERRYGVPFFAYTARNPEFAAVFNEAMTSITDHVADAVAATLDLGAYQTLVDVAGGQGVLLAAVLGKTAGQRGVLFDQADVIESARAVLEKGGVADRVQLASGDFFVSVPEGGDAYLLKYILHDWDDERSGRILASIHRAARPGARLFVIDAVLPPGNTPDVGKLMDLAMLIQPGGRERTEKEFAALLGRAGFSVDRVVPTGTHVSVIESTRS